MPRIGDIQLVLNGTLPSTANPEALVEWLEALQRLNDTAMAEKQGVLEWLDKEGTIKGYATHRRERHRKLREEFLAKEKIRLEKEEADAQARIAKKRELARKKALSDPITATGNASLCTDSQLREYF